MGDDEEDQSKKKGTALPIWGNQQTMNINNLVVTNILSSPYFKNELFKIKTFHEVIDEIYYKVDHLEPWEKGSRKIRGQVGMCGGVRGVGTGGIVSSTFCLLFKLFTLKLTQKQVYALINHTDSPYIRALGFMFIRYCQHPNTYWEWFEPYLEDDEEVDPKAGGGCTMTLGQMVRSFLLKPDWYGTLFPRIPVPIFKEIEAGLKELNLNDDRKVYANDEEQRDRPEEMEEPQDQRGKDGDFSFGEAEKYAALKREERKTHSDTESRHKDKDTHRSSHGQSRDRTHDRPRNRSRERSGGHRERSQDRSREKSRDRSYDRSRDKSRKRPRSRERERKRSRDGSPRSPQKHSSDRNRRRSRSRDKRR